MASDLLDLLVRANLAAAGAIVAVLALRLGFGRWFGARVGYALWLIAPLAVLAVFIPPRQVRVAVTPPVAAVSHPVSRTAQEETHVAPPAPGMDLAELALLVWGLGAVAHLAIMLRRQCALRASLGELREEDWVFRASRRGVSPMLIGVFRPRIVVPADFEARFTPREQAIVLAHERAHLRAGHHLVNAAAALAQCVGWCNPFVHIAVRRMREDQELACDAAVIARHPDQRRSYGEAMLKAQLAPVAAPLACAWRGHPLKRRIAMLEKAIPTRRTRAAGLSLVVIIASAATVAAWAAQPARIVTAARPIAPTGSGLAEASAAGDLAGVAALLDAGDDVNAAVAGEGNPLIQASAYGHQAVAALLLEHGADANAAVPGDGNPLIQAAAHGHRAIAALLLEHGADVNGFVPLDETPLITAVRLRQPAMVRFLVEHGADVNKRVATGNAPRQTRSPLSVARDPQTAGYLRAHGARD